MDILMKTNLKIYHFLFAASLLFLSGCKSLDLQGTYVGVLNSLNNKGQPQDYLVKIEIEAVDTDNAKLEIKSLSNLPLPIPAHYQLAITKLSGGLVLSGLDTLHPEISLSYDETDKCWHGSELSLLICYNENSFDFQTFDSNLTKFHITAKRNYSPSYLEVPKNKSAFTIEELKKLVKEKSFDSRMEYQRVLEARKNAQANYMALAPRLTLGTVGSLLSGNGVALFLSVMSDLTPFLFPTNWIKAHEAGLQADAENITQKIMKADSQLSVETLADLILRDEISLSYYNEMIASAQVLHDSIQIRENLGQYPVGSTDNIQSILNSLYSDKMELTKNIQQQKYSLSIMVGFDKPEKIQKISWKKEAYPVGFPLSVTKNNLIQEAQDHSLERSQLEKIIAISKNEEQKAYWSWIDPSGSALTGLGLPYGVMIEISKEKTQELQIQKEQIMAYTNQKASEAYENYATALQEYKLSQINLDLQNKRKQLFEEKINLGLQVDFFGLLSVLQDNLNAKVKMATAEANYRVSRAAIQRLMNPEQE